MRVIVMAHDGIDALCRRTRRGDLANSPRFRDVLPFAEGPVQSVAITEHSPDERPEPVMLLRIGKLFAANNEHPIKNGAPRLQHDIEALDILRPVNLFDP